MTVLWTGDRTGHRTVPSEVEPNALSDLIADCAVVQTRVIDLTTTRVIRLPEQPAHLVIDPEAVRLLDGLGDYGSC